VDTIHQFGGSWDKDFTQREVDLIFEAARDQGVNLIDTAECYGDHQAESLVGGSIRRELERRGLREFFLEVRRGDETGSLKELKGKFPGTVLFAGDTEYDRRFALRVHDDLSGAVGGVGLGSVSRSQRTPH